jgi:hypothetical protein
MLNAVDMPFSIIWDTICLPCDAASAALAAHYQQGIARERKPSHNTTQPKATDPATSDR